MILILRGLAFFVFGMIDQVAMLFNAFFALISLVFLVFILFPLGPDSRRDWPALLLPGGIYVGALLVRWVCQKIMKRLDVSPYQPLKPLDLSRYIGKKP